MNSPQPETTNNDSGMSCYPPLAKVVVVDSRFSSRSELLACLDSLNLFQNVVEAPSVQDGLRLMGSEEVDLCIVGPSVTTDVASDFLARCQETRLSKDSALIAVTSNDGEAISCLRKSGAQAVIQRPFTKQMFLVSVVDSVIEANAASPWRAVRAQEQSTPGQPLEARKNMQVPWQKSDQQITPSKPMSAQLQQAMRRAATSAARLLRDIATGVATRKYTYDVNGNPSSTTLAAVKSVAAQIIDEKGELDEQTLAFRQYLEQVLTVWVTDLRRLPHKEANDRLRLALLSYTTESK
jgi:YD repeat-containing protein